MRSRYSIGRRWLAVVVVVIIAAVAIVGWGTWRNAPALVAAVATGTPQATPPPTAVRTLSPSPGLPAKTPALEPLPTARPSPAATPLATPTAVHPTLPGAVRSDGCTKTLEEAGDSTIDLSVDGIERSALAHMPAGAGPAIPLPLVLAFHGTAADAQGMAELTKLSDEADIRGFLVVYPNALGEPTAWNARESAGAAKDFAFAQALLDRITADYCVDLHRIYAVGFSIGGAMAQLVACRSAQIAAIALVAAVHGEGGTKCVPARPVATVFFHGVLDPLVPWRGGPFPLPDFELPDAVPVLDWAAQWAAANGCDPDPFEGEAIGWVVPFEWDVCAAPLMFYRIGDGGHSWPGGGGTTAFGTINTDISATAVAVDFLLANAIPPEPVTFTNARLGFSVELPASWSTPWPGGYGDHAGAVDGVTFPVGRPAFVIWATTITVTVGGAGIGPWLSSDRLEGRTARQLAKSLAEKVNGYELSDSTLPVDAEFAVIASGTANGKPLPLAATFAHGGRPFLVVIYHELGMRGADDRGLLSSFLEHFHFIDP